MGVLTRALEQIAHHEREGDYAGQVNAMRAIARDALDELHVREQYGATPTRGAVSDERRILPTTVWLCPIHSEEFWVPHGGRCPEAGCEDELVAFDLRRAGAVWNPDHAAEADALEAERDELRDALEDAVNALDTLKPGTHTAAQGRRVLDTTRA